MKRRRIRIRANRTDKRHEIKETEKTRPENGPGEARGNRPWYGCRGRPVPTIRNQNLVRLECWSRPARGRRSAGAPMRLRSRSGSWARTLEMIGFGDDVVKMAKVRPKMEKSSRRRRRSGSEKVGAVVKVGRRSPPISQCRPLSPPISSILPVVLCFLLCMVSRVF